MPMETRSSSALFKRAEQLRRWQESETNQEPSVLSKEKARRIKFSDGCVFLAACAAGDKDEVERLLTLGADINTANVDGLTALHQACIDDNLDMVEFLVEHGCDLNRGDNEGWTPLHATSSCGFVSIARYLIESGANVAAVNNDGDLPIDIGESVEIEELLQAEINRLGIDCDALRVQEESMMLEDANQWLNARCVQEDLHPKTGASALHVASAKGYIKVMSLLIQAGVDLNAQDNDGWTPLHAASHWGQKEACQILAENLANMDIKNFSGQTCFDVCDPDLLKLLEELKNKQASMQRERPEIQAILQRPCKAPPPLRRRTSVTRMSGADKSSQVMKDTILERAQIEANLRLEEEEEDDKLAERKVTPAATTNEVVGNEEKEAAVKKQVNDVERIPDTPKSIPETKEVVEQVKLKVEMVEHLPQPAIPSLKKEPTVEDKSIFRKTDETPKIAPNLPSSVETPSAPPTVPSTVLTKIALPSEKPKGEIISAVPVPIKLKLKTERVFMPPTRDEESEAQRKAHAKRVRETRRSTQGVTLEDLKSAEQQFLRKQQEEDERKERESDLSKPALEAKVAVPTTCASTAITTAVTTSVPSAIPTSTITTVTSVVSTASPTIPEKRISWRTRSDDNLKTKEEPKDTKEEAVVLRRSAETNHLQKATVPVTTSNAPAVTVNTTAPAPSATTTSVPIRTRQRPVSAPADSSDTKSIPSVILPPRTRIKTDSLADLEDKNTEDQENDPDNKLGQQGTQSAIQRRRRPKRRSTGVVFIDGEGTNEVKPEGPEDMQVNEKDEEKTNVADRYRNRYGSSSSLQDGNTTPSRLSDRSRTTSLNSSTSSLNEEADKDYKKLYLEMKDENERLKKKLGMTESELDSTKIELQKAQRNMRNSLNDADKRERRALERKLSELEEEVKEFEKIQADNQRLRDENGALIRVISKLSK